MAFSKAKIMRFNDVKTCAPAPGSYDPKYDGHVPGVKYVKETKSDTQSPASSNCDARSVHSGISISSFRTPTVPCRKNLKISNSKGNKNTLSSSLKSEALREKIVECTNKDETIKDLETQLEEQKFAIGQLTVEKNNLVSERDELSLNIKQVQLEIENLKKQLAKSNIINEENEKIKTELKEANRAQIKEFQENLALLQDRLNEHNVQVGKTETELHDTKVAYQKLENEFKIISGEYASIKVKYEESLEKNNNLKTNHSLQMENLTRLHKTERIDSELEMQKFVANWKAIVNKVENDYASKIKDLESQQTLELEKLKDSKSVEHATLQQHINKLGKEKEQLYYELQDIQTKLEKEIDEHQNAKSAALAEKHRYEVTLIKTCDTVNTLKNRLLNSDRDVEQLTKELETLEKSKFESEKKYSEENEKLKKEIEDLKYDQKALLNLYKEIENVKVQLLDKIDGFKTKANSEISRLTRVVQKQSEELKKLHSYIQEQQKVHSDAFILITDAKNEIETLEKRISEHQCHNSQSRSAQIENQDSEEDEDPRDKQIRELIDILKKRDLELNELASIYKKYIEKSGLYDELLQKQDELQMKCADLEKTVSEQNSLIGPFREQLENYEQECQMLLFHKGEAEKEAKEMGLKYAQVLGHQNLKQKLKHIVDLKKRNIELMESNQNNETKILRQARTIEKLKQQLSQQSKMKNSDKLVDKENVGSPVRAPSMNSPIALKERN